MVRVVTYLPTHRIALSSLLHENEGAIERFVWWTAYLHSFILAGFLCGNANESTAKGISVDFTALFTNVSHVEQELND